MKLFALDLFSGLGGFSLAMDKVGIETVAFCEMDPMCQAVLNHHWPKKKVFSNVKDLTYKECVGTWENPEAEYRALMTEDMSSVVVADQIDLIVGGYPCTGHSVAGKKEGFKNEGSDLWREYLRLTKKIKPRYCIIENSHNLRSTGLAELLKAFNEIGYNAEWSIISGYAVGAPHQRERIYIVFWRGDIPYPHAFRYWETDTKKAETSQGWWAKRRFKRDSVFGKVSQIGSRVLQLADGVSKRLVKIEEYKVAMLGNALIPQIPELIVKAIVELEESLNG